MIKSGRLSKFSLALTALCMVMATGAVQAKELIYGAWVSDKHSVMRLAMPPFMEGVAKDTNGEITWKLVAGGQLVDGRGTLAGIKDGLIDAGMAIPGYTPKPLAATNLVFSTLVFGDDLIAASAAAVETVLLECAECTKELKDSNAVFLGGYDGSAFMMMCRSEVKTVEDLKGKKVRTSGGGVALMKLAGATPVAMDPASATSALQTGALDCVLGAPTWLKSYGYEDVAKYIVDYPLGMVGPVMSMLINRSAWDKMTDDQKMAHLKHMPKYVSQATIDAYLVQDGLVVKAAQDAGKVTLNKGGEDFDELTTAFKKMQDETNIANAKSLGVKDPEGILAAYEKSLEKWKGLSKEIGGDEAKYQAALKAEIYDKVDLGKL